MWTQLTKAALTKLRKANRVDEIYFPPPTGRFKVDFCLNVPPNLLSLKVDAEMIVVT
jgi:hypothetical protein